MKSEQQPIANDLGNEFQVLRLKRKDFITVDGSYDAEAWCEFKQ